ncbi:MAG: hypothetical protein SFT91_05495 [Rickettsiaceae bacterium]|nr:hypothetical protein [Rickettsiaceae bacterium]
MKFPQINLQITPRMKFIAVILVIVSAILFAAGYIALFLMEAKKVAQAPSPFSKVWDKLGFENRVIKLPTREPTRIDPLVLFEIKKTKGIDKPENSMKDVFEDQFLSKEDQQEAFLRVMHMTGRFRPENLWGDLNKLGQIQNTKEIYAQILPDFIKSGATQNNPDKFNSTSLRKKLFKNASLSESDIADWILFISQYSFRRKPGVERNEIIKQSWMLIHEARFFQEVEKLGLIHREYPKNYEYDAAWISGASRYTTMSRIIDFSQLYGSKTIKIGGDITVLAGDRPLWAEIDGISYDAKEILKNTWKNGSNIDQIPPAAQNAENFHKVLEGKE